jgi:hypothetical protein
MSEKYQHRYRSDSARAQWWDYGWNGAYFITICTKGRARYQNLVTNTVSSIIGGYKSAEPKKGEPANKSASHWRLPAVYYRKQQRFMRSVHLMKEIHLLVPDTEAENIVAFAISAGATLIEENGVPQWQIEEVRRRLKMAENVPEAWLKWDDVENSLKPRATV